MHHDSGIRNHWFRDLAAGWPQTAAASLPLVIWQDTIGPGLERVTLRHVDFLSLYIARQGRGVHIIDGVPYGVARGDVYAMGLGMTHLFSDCDDLVLDTLHFSPAIFDPPALDALAETPGFQSLFVEEPLHRRETNGKGGRWLHLAPDAYAAIAADLAELRSEWAAGTPSGTLLTRGLFVRLLVHLARCYAQSALPGGSPAPPARDATVAVALQYLDDHFAEPLRIEEVAGAVFLSPDRFTEVFAGVVGRTPRDYLRHIRLERAKTLLATTDAPVFEVGLQAGFGEAAYFTRVFRAATGLTPRRYRSRARSE